MSKDAIHNTERTHLQQLEQIADLLSRARNPLQALERTLKRLGETL